MAKRLKSFINSIKIYGFWRIGKKIYAKLSFYFLKFILKRSIAVKTIHGNKMYLDLKNHGISEALWLEGTREELDVEIVQREVKPGMNILEVGSNIGYYLLIEASVMKGRGKIYAFEPDPRNVALLKRNVALNHLEEMVVFYPYAVSDKESGGKFYLAKFSNLSAMKSQDDSLDYIDVKTIKIDDFEAIKGEINFVRMDIEGHEYEAIKGMIGTLAKSEDIRILVELHPRSYGPERDFAQMVRELYRLGFKAKYLVSAGEHSPKVILSRGYRPTKIDQGMVHSHGLYENVAIEDLIAFMENPVKIVRSVLFAKTNYNVG